MGVNRVMFHCFVGLRDKRCVCAWYEGM